MATELGSKLRFHFCQQILSGVRKNKLVKLPSDFL